ncbi:expressed protein [Phakopsora pachyrhizi]|uniref:Expressed protein n=1 Tax=Phakopsora pachyrhizi TaxID=170000 RepID=A0AAV0B701_PHAPC|nr:expressed protein [Phakopsora pachyrhizi]
MRSANGNRDGCSSDEDQTGPLAKFRSLSPSKQFGLITLTAVGTTMLMTGRTVRAIMRRLPGDESGRASVKLGNCTIHPNRPPVISQQPSNLRGPESGRHQSGSGDEFNPAMDALRALGIATTIVVGVTGLVINRLGERYELENSDDWRIWIQSGQLRRMIINDQTNKTLREIIPDRLRLSVQTGSENQSTGQEVEEEDLRLKLRLRDWSKRFEEEWDREITRREEERISWESQRQADGKRIWR